MIAGRGLMIFRLRLAVTTAIQVAMHVCMYVCQHTPPTSSSSIMIATCSSTHAIITSQIHCCPDQSTSQVHCCTIPHHIAITTAALTIPRQVPNCSMQRSWPRLTATICNDPAPCSMCMCTYIYIYRYIKTFNIQCNPHDHHHANLMVLTISTTPRQWSLPYQAHGHDRAIRNLFCDGSGISAQTVLGLGLRASCDEASRVNTLD